MNHYTFPRYLAAGAAFSLLAACAHHAVKPAPATAAAPAPATMAAPAAATAAPESAPAMQPTAPDRYTVKKGDTLWGIASMYLKDPWRWPDIWYDNPAIKNPHLIFPGDVLILGRNSQGQPTLSVERNGTPVIESTNVTAAAPATAAATVSATPALATAAPLQNVSKSSLPVTKLEPEPRYHPLDAAVTTIPLNGLLPYLDKTRIVNGDDLDASGYVVTAFNEGPAAGSNEEVYVRNLKSSDGTRYEILRKGDKYVDPDSGRTLGYEATYIGDAEVEAWSSPAKVMVLSSTQEVIAGDHLMVTHGDPLNINFFPHHPAKPLSGQIMAVVGGVGQIGQYAVVVLNRGSDDGMDPGTVLGIFRKGDTVKDANGGFFSSNVTLPTERTGTLMVFRVFKNASYALVMEANHEVHTADYIGNP